MTSPLTVILHRKGGRCKKGGIANRKSRKRDGSAKKRSMANSAKFAVTDSAVNHITNKHKAMEAWLADYSNIPSQPTWKTFADILYASKIYE
jgi:hypothetical protein